MAALDLLFDIAPEFAGNDPAQLARFVGYAAAEINRTLFGAKADIATANLAAHMLTVATRGATGQGGVASMQKAGMLEEQYKVPNLRESEQPWATTVYGLEYIRIRRSVLMGFRVL